MIMEGLLDDSQPGVRCPSKGEILDKSKDDLFTKILAIVHITQFLLEVFVRLGRGLEISQLELGVAGFVGCAVVTYLCCLLKPKAVGSATILAEFPGALPCEMDNFVSDGWKTDDGTWKGFSSDIIYHIFGATEGRKRLVIPLRTGSAEGVLGFTVLTLVGTGFGAVHVAGWNLPFPTDTDAWLWRSAALASTAVIPTVLVLGAVLGTFSHQADSWEVSFYGLAIVTYCFSRLVLMIEMVRCLFYLPPAAFVTTWTTNIPHIG